LRVVAYELGELLFAIRKQRMQAQPREPDAHEIGAKHSDAETVLDAHYVLSAFGGAVMRFASGSPERCPKCGSYRLEPIYLSHKCFFGGWLRWALLPDCPSSAQNREAPPRLDSSTWVHSLGVVIRAAARQWGPRAWLDAPGCSWLEAPRIQSEERQSEKWKCVG
jgi:hypothetical protein